MLVQAVVYKSANKVSDEELVTNLPLEYTLHSAQYWRPHPGHTGSPWKQPDHTHPPGALLPRQGSRSGGGWGRASGRPEPTGSWTFWGQSLSWTTKTVSRTTCTSEGVDLPHPFTPDYLKLKWNLIPPFLKEVVVQGSAALPRTVSLRWNHSDAFLISALKTLWGGDTPETKVALDELTCFTVITLASLSKCGPSPEQAISGIKYISYLIV